MLGSVPGAKQRHMVDSVEQWDNRSGCFWTCDSGQCRFQLRSLHREPEHINGRNFRSDRNIDSKISERTLQPKLLRIVLERLAPHHQRNENSRVRQASPDQAAYATGPQNRMSHRL
jgi:hypothetical protein